MKQIFIIIVLVSIIAGIFGGAVPTNAQLPFGGFVVPISPCNTGFLYLVVPYGLFMFIKPPAGVAVLGLAAIAPIPCILGIIPMGVGFPVILSN